MRSITEGEAIAIRSFLAALPVSGRQRISETGLGSRTFARIRKRAYSLGWVFDRYVPNPSLAGFETVFFAVVQPFTENIEQILNRWKEMPSNILLWRWPETVFGVFFSNAPRDKFLAELNATEGRSETFMVASSAKSPSIPVYFDFEAVWNRLTSQHGTLAYPHPLATEPKEGAYPGPDRTDSRCIAELLARPFRPSAEYTPLHVNPFFFPRSQQKLLETGMVERRTILDPQKVPPFQGRSIERFAFVQAELNSPGTEETLFRMLMAIRVTPFLFASDGSRILLATLSQEPSNLQSGAGHPAILRSLQRLLKDIRIVRESVQTLTVLVNHRYDRLIPSEA
jgi:hypothetical protein